MPYNELPGLGMRGLNRDTPPQALDHTQFSKGNNMRPFDSSLQTVFAFGDNDTNIAPTNGAFPTEDRTDIYGLSGWIETGANELRLAYIWQSSDDAYNVQIIDDLTANGNFIEGANADTMLTSNPRWGQQILSFNGVLIVNDSVNQPIVITYDDASDEYRADFVLGWLSQASENSDIITALDGLTFPLAADTDITIPAAVTEDSADTFTLPEDSTRASAESLINQSYQREPANRVTTERIAPYNGRLVALNIQGNYLNDPDDNGGLGNSSIVWSTPIEQLESLNGVTFRFTSDNSAGDDILTETPGETLDAGTLGEYLIVYKDDAVYRTLDSGDPLYLISQPIFTDDGLYSPDCFADLGGGRHFVLGNYGAYIHDGGPNKQNVSRDRVQRELYSSIDPSYRNNTFVFHHENDKEVWICYRSRNSAAPVVGANEAYVYNYELDTWYTRTLGHDLRGISSFEKDGELWILGFGDTGVFRLGDERRNTSTHLSGSIELHYLPFGENDKVKYLSAVYPHTTGQVELNIDTTNNLGISGEPDFPDRANKKFNAETQDMYKLDYRVNGRYYHIKVQSTVDSDDTQINPSLTGLGFDIKLGGHR